MGTRTRPMRVPEEFERFIGRLSSDFNRETGLPPSNTATMRRLANWADSKIVTKGAGFDVIIIGRRKKR